jgi:hypothetical protein
LFFFLLFPFFWFHPFGADSFQLKLRYIFGGGGNVSTRNDKEWSELSLHHFSY